MVYEPVDLCGTMETYRLGCQLGCQNGCQNGCQFPTLSFTYYYRVGQVASKTLATLPHLSVRLDSSRPSRGNRAHERGNLAPSSPITREDIAPGLTWWSLPSGGVLEVGGPVVELEAVALDEDSLALVGRERQGAR